MRRRRRIGWSTVLVAWLVASAVAADEDRPTLDHLQVAIGNQQIAISAELDNAFDDELRERLASGLPTELTYRFALYKDRKRWFDGELAKSTYQVIAMYNAVSREYLVNFKHDGKLTETRVVRDLVELERAMTALDRVPVFDLMDLRPKVQNTAEQSRLLVRARAELGSDRWLFVFPTKTTTDWVRSRKFRLNDTP
ncbi:MAG: DUF4390 domain-containing protein [Thermoanaerobaculia bacterium]|nr:DUF4390 domain-containing protein [Thermoanaerobaculia bacterium]